MRYAIGVSLLAALIGGSPAAPQVALSPELRRHVQEERLQIVTSVRGLPLGVRNALQMLFASQALDIADPGADFEVSGVTGNTTRPIRRLVSAGCSYEHCLVYYERGGASRTWRVALFHWTPDATRFEGGGIAPGGLSTVDDVRSAFLSAAIKDPAGLW